MNEQKQEHLLATRTRDELLVGFADLDAARQVLEDAIETRDLRSTERQHEIIERESRRLGVTVEDVMRACHEREHSADPQVDEYIRNVSDAWAKGVRTPQGLAVHEAGALIQLFYFHTWTFGPHRLRSEIPPRGPESANISQETTMTDEPRPDAATEQAMLEVRQTGYLRRVLEEERELDLWEQEADEAERTGEYRSTARQSEMVNEACTQVLETTVEAVMRICHGTEHTDTWPEARHIRRVRDAWARGARTARDLTIQEAWSLWYLIVKHEWEYYEDDDEDADPTSTPGPNGASLPAL